MSLSPSQPLLVQDLDYLRNMSQLVEKMLLMHRCALGGVGEVLGVEIESEDLWVPRTKDTVGERELQRGDKVSVG